MKVETKELLEDRIVDLLESAEIKAGNRVRETTMLLNELREVERDEMEYADKKEQRSIERQRNADMVMLEQEKKDTSRKQMLVNIAIAVVPTVLTMIGYGIYQKRILEFEETGRVNSTAGRELHLPRFYK